MALTLHGISRGWTLETFVLEVAPLKRGETALELAATVRHALQEWGLEMRRLVAACTDTTPVMPKAVKEHLGVQWVLCLGHVLNLAVRAGLRAGPVRRLVKKATAITKFFRRSPKAAALLRHNQQALQCPLKTLKLDVKTRWNSTYKMLRRLTKAQSAVSATLSAGRASRRPQIYRRTNGRTWWRSPPR